MNALPEIPGEEGNNYETQALDHSFFVCGVDSHKRDSPGIHAGQILLSAGEVPRPDNLHSRRQRIWRNSDDQQHRQPDRRIERCK